MFARDYGRRVEQLDTFEMPDIFGEAVDEVRPVVLEAPALPFLEQTLKYQAFFFERPLAAKTALGTIAFVARFNVLSLFAFDRATQAEEYILTNQHWQLSRSDQSGLQTQFFTALRNSRPSLSSLADIAEHSDHIWAFEARAQFATAISSL